MYVAIQSIKKNGKPVFYVNPKKTTEDPAEAFPFKDRKEAVQQTCEAEKIYKNKFYIVEVNTEGDSKEKIALKE